MSQTFVIPGAREERVVHVEDLEVRAGEGEAPIIVGHPVVYGKWSEDLGGFRERIVAGAAKRTIGIGDDIRALFNHDPNYVIGRTKAGTLELEDGPRAVSMKATPPETSWASDLMTSMRRGDIDQMSFAFRAIHDEWREPKKEGALWERDITELAMYDVSVVTFPAYVQTDAQVRSVLSGAGIDFDALTAFLARHDRGLSPTSSDIDLLNGSIAALRSLIPPDPEPAQPVTTLASPEPGRSAAHLRALLELEAAR